MPIPHRTYGAMEIRLRESLITRALVLPVQEFIHIQGISSVVLLGAAIVALLAVTAMALAVVWLEQAPYERQTRKFSG